MELTEENKWLTWAISLQCIAQAGLYYGKQGFDLERYQAIRDISRDMIAHQTDLSPEKVTDLFCNGIGSQTPKLDTRAVIFIEDKILLVKENNGFWSLPGGWVDVDLSIKENTIKEVKEEAGLDVQAERIIAIMDRAKHNLPLYPYGVTKVFVECKVLGGSFQANSETIASQYFSLSDIPRLATEKNTVEQVELCFKAKNNNDWKVFFD